MNPLIRHSPNDTVPAQPLHGCSSHGTWVPACGPCSRGPEYTPMITLRLPRKTLRRTPCSAARRCVRSARLYCPDYRYRRLELPVDVPSRAPPARRGSKAPSRALFWSDYSTQGGSLLDVRRLILEAATGALLLSSNDLEHIVSPLSRASMADGDHTSQWLSARSGRWRVGAGRISLGDGSLGHRFSTGGWTRVS